MKKLDCFKNCFALVQRFPLCPEPTEIRGVWQNGFANFAPMYGGGKLPMN